MTSTTLRHLHGTSNRMMRRSMLVVAPAAAIALLLSACGGSSDAGGSPAAATTPTAATTPGQGGPPGADGGRGFRGMDFTKIQQCLDAAGLDITLPTFDPNNRPSGMPSLDPNSTERPSPPADRVVPSGAPGDGQGFGGGNGPGGAVREFFTNPDVQAALEACGIELPQRPQTSPSA